MGLLAKLRRRVYRGRRGMGQRWEARAEAFLKGEGYRIRERNYRGRSAEIDLIADHEGVLCFIEVKGRGGSGFGAPEEAVGPQKQQRIARAAEEYLHRKRIRGVACRFDVVAVLEEPGAPARVTLFRDAFPLPDEPRL